jgi:hypothetical protein
MINPALAGIHYQCLCLNTENYTAVNQTCLTFGTYGDTCNSNGRSCEPRYGMKICLIYHSFENLSYSNRS